MAAGCTQPHSVRVKADFTTDKEVYNLYDEVALTNLSFADGGEIDIYKWEWGDGNVSFEEVPSSSVTSEVEAEIRIRLTVVVSAYNVGDTCSRVVRFVDGNIPPTADFTWSPTPVYKGRTILLSDTSTDPDGKIVSRIWNVAGVEYTDEAISIVAMPDKPAPSHVATRGVAGDIDPLTPPVQVAEMMTVTLTVVDNGRKEATITKQIPVYNEDD